MAESGAEPLSGEIWLTMARQTPLLSAVKLVFSIENPPWFTQDQIRILCLRPDSDDLTRLNNRDAFQVNEWVWITTEIESGQVPVRRSFPYCGAVATRFLRALTTANCLF